MNTRRFALFGGAAVFAFAIFFGLLPQQLEAQAVHVPSDNRAVAYGSSPTALTAGTTGRTIQDLEGRPYVNTAHPFPVHCTLTTTATTSTQVTGCELVAAKSIYVTGLVVAGDAANAVSTPWILQSGTSTGCTGPAILVAGYHAALTTNAMTFNPPIKATAAHGLCILDGTTGTKKMTIVGYVAP